MTHNFYLNNPLINSALAIVLGLVISILMSLLMNTEWFSRLSVKGFNRTPNNSIWRDVLDLKNGSNLKVYIVDQPYYVIGHHKCHEEKDGECWLALSAFGKYDKETNEVYKLEPTYHDDVNIIYTVRFSDIEHIEIF